MASSLGSDKPNLPAPTDGANDPFVSNTPAPAHHRYSTFDNDLFAAGPASSPRQAKRALEAHLAETERRLEEAGKLGTALVSQRKALTERLQEVEKLQAEDDMNPELRQKLVEIEKEYNDLARESARAFLPKQRVPSNEINPGSPFVQEGRSGRRSEQRSVSPSKFESQATGSPTKLSVPNRKIRNQPSNRVHDIEFAAEISTSLLAQVRNLQAMLSERDEELRDLKSDKSKLEIESENFQQRAKTLDESEHRYKEENWNLETRLQELSTQQKEAADREKKLTQALNISKAEKVSAQKELDEVKLSHSKLSEEHTSAIKHHDIELGTVKRNIAMAEGERSAMQRKIDDLTHQNQELARAFSTQRGRILDRESNSGLSEEDRESAADNITPEHSPPPSPIKGTPRHSMLETETMKSSLHHAQRTIQSQRGLLHREKTEKLELRRIIQDLRDDLEKVRTDSGANSSSRKNRKTESRESKRVPRLLGNFRSSRQEVIHTDPDWEDHQELSPGTSPSITSSPVMRQSENLAIPTDNSDQFDTANEASESAFETANERGTETEDFLTVNEEFSGSDAETETESMSRGFGRMKRPPSLPMALARPGNRDSFHSTASTSADEDDFTIMRTPTGNSSSQRSSRFRLSRGPFSRSSRQASEEPALRSSPASFASSAGDTPQAGQSLFAELQDFEGSDDESVAAATPSRSGTRSGTPGSISRAFTPPPTMPTLGKVAMVDSGVMTDPVKILPSLHDIELPTLADSSIMTEGQDESMPGSPVSVVARDRPMSMESVVGPSDNRGSLLSWPSIREDGSSRPVSMSYSDAGAQYDPDMEKKLAQFPAPPTMLPTILQIPPTLSMSSISSEDIEPLEEVPVLSSPPALSMVPIWNQAFDPVAEPATPPPALSMTSIWQESVEPVATPPPVLSFAAITAEHLEPMAEPEIPPPVLSMSSMFAEHHEPRALPEVPPPALSTTSIWSESIEPRAEPEKPLAPLSFSTIVAEGLEPVAEPIKPLPTLSFSAIAAEGLHPVAEYVEPLPKLSLTNLSTETVDPIPEPEVPAPSLSISHILAESLEPVAEPAIVAPTRPALGMSSISREHIEPIVASRPKLGFSTISGEQVEPVRALEPTLALSSILTEHVEPIAEPEPEPIVPVLAELSLSGIQREHVEPIAEMEPELPHLGLSMVFSEAVEPVIEPVLEVAPPQLSLSSLAVHNVEPIAEPEVVLPAPIIPEVPQLSMSNISREHVEPIAEPAPVLPKLPQLSMSTISREHVEPIIEPQSESPILGLSSIQREHIEPIAPEIPELTLSSLSMENVEPLSEPEVVILPPSLHMSSIFAEHWEPREEPQVVVPPAALNYSNISTEHVEPVSEPERLSPFLAMSPMVAENVTPILEPLPRLPTLGLSSIATEGVEPSHPLYKSPSVRNFGFSPIETIETLPISPRSPKRDGFILPRDMNSPFMQQDAPETPTKDKFVPIPVRSKKRDSSPFIAEDETRQSLRNSPDAETPESQRPFKEMSSNSNVRPVRKAPIPTSDQGAQTALTADTIDEMFKARARSYGYDREMSATSFGTPGTNGTSGTVRVRRRSQDSFGSPSRRKGKSADDAVFDSSPVRRPGSATSGRTSIQDAPPLPPNHRQVIEAARSGSAHGAQGNMGPPLWPASALKQRPTTPSQVRPMSPMSARGTPTPRAGRTGLTRENLEVQSPGKLTARSRQSSVSSFASEIDNRFNMRPGDMGIDPTGFGPNTDPRMIQAITQTMIGEYLWKYTRKTGRGEMSENRHRRYFWVHPYTRTLYWSDRDPSTAGRTELKAKSVAIEAVRVVTDDNPMPPGLHRKSLVVISPGRTIKFTCTTGQRHETWFNALSYLLLRTNNEGQSDTEELAENITREDVDEFNPQFGRRAANGNRAPPSLSSYRSRTTRNESPAVGMSMNIPTLTPTPHKASTPHRQSGGGTLSKLSGYWKSGQGLSGTFSSRRSRAPSAQNLSIYEASETHDSAEDLREMIERQDREADRLENVRACCDGKHDVGTLHHHFKKGRSNNNAHSHPPGQSSSNTPLASVRSRA
ncbi:hypothetical protein G7046_g2910 [Stylonectria norvegica]|nr:hypothetical protein G7046_g2910 [Stylonectria norvegica]